MRFYPQKEVSSNMLSWARMIVQWLGCLFTLHVADLSFIPGTLYGSLSITSSEL